jgi:hypothetical protein
MASLRDIDPEAFLFQNNKKVNLEEPIWYLQSGKDGFTYSSFCIYRVWRVDARQCP